MKIRLYIYWSGLFLCGLMGASCTADKNIDTNSNSRKIRAGYMSTESMDIIQTMAQAGMNLALVKFNTIRTPLQEDDKKQLIEWARSCEQAGIRFMPVINFWGAYEKNWVKPEYKFYYKQQFYPQTPCPLEVNSYRQIVHDRVLEIAHLSQTASINGIALDLEMYGADFTSFPDGCLCDHCFDKYSSEKSLTLFVEPEQRYEYLKRTYQIQAYRQFFQSQIEQLTRQTKQELKNLTKDFALGVLHFYQRGLYNKSFLKGLGSGEYEVLAFAENTYSQGYGPIVKAMQKELSTSGIHARLVVGIWQDKFPPENLAEQYYYCARDAAGYWIYTTESLSEHTIKTLPSEKALYWQAIRQANRELDALAANPDYRSLLRIRSFQMPPQIPDTNIQLPALQYVRQNNLTVAKNAYAALQFRGKTTLVFLVQKNEMIHFLIDLRKFGRSNQASAFVVLSNYSGEILTRSLATFEKQAEIRFPAPQTGAYALTFDPAGNAAKVTTSSHPFSIAVNEKINLLRPSQSLYFWKPLGNIPASITMEVDGPGEAVIAIFKNAKGKIIGQYDIVSRHTITLPLSDRHTGEYIELTVQSSPNAVFEDLQIKVESGLEKFMSPTQSGLLQVNKD